jgi:hypothetical protein
MSVNCDGLFGVGEVHGSHHLASAIQASKIATEPSGSSVPTIILLVEDEPVVSNVFRSCSRRKAPCSLKPPSLQKVFLGFHQRQHDIHLETSPSRTVPASGRGRVSLTRTELTDYYYLRSSALGAWNRVPRDSDRVRVRPFGEEHGLLLLNTIAHTETS